MKIRIKGNTIRYRLTRSEVTALCSKGSVIETTNFNTSTFTYLIKKSELSRITAHFVENTITVQVPEAMLANWDTNTVIGLENTLILDDKTTLAILIEKDFTCLDERGEDESDNYPNPLAKKKNG
ncbi:hypothetical protein MWU65_08375 [Cellulophaga sp. F20128]|uniref:DUF7009 family protein n=1 Tax=Cellulophaga sp. F20128 TaxID=2926413 RepID=UPI001FF34969|nr:hypothetical protein [Cellulophaga sp. F20128]MCK0157188.1 hypothetical protein [Cellulophaga sp. F20128]